MNDMNETNPIRAYRNYCCVDLENETKRETQFATPVHGPKIGRCPPAGKETLLFDADAAGYGAAAVSTGLAGDFKSSSGRLASAQATKSQTVPNSRPASRPNCFSTSSRFSLKANNVKKAILRAPPARTCPSRSDVLAEHAG